VYEEAGTHELKGKAEPMPLWRAERVVAGRGGALRASGLEPPFVGRDRELRLIKELFHGSADERRPHLVSVIGVGGIGKSRLAWEFEKYLDGLVSTVRWHRGRCLAYGEGVAFWALAEMVRMRAGIAEAEEAGSARAKLRAAIEEHVPDAEERRWIQPRLSSLLGLEERSPGDQESLFSAWRTFFERLADEHPTLMIFEDLHWADSALLDFVEYLVEWSRDRPIFILTLARPELLERRPTWGAGRRNFTSLFLDPLGDELMGTLLATPVPGLPDELQKKILERAEGIPFYAVETVRMLIDRGLLVREGNRYRTTGPVDLLEVPETLHTLIAARLDGLDAEERSALQDASVLGRFFTVEGLAALTGRTVEQLEPLLSSLVRKELLTLQTDPRSPERGQYGFLQDLVKKVAYETLSRKDRKARHLVAAEHLESVFGIEEGEFAEIIASHYSDAYRSAPEAPDAQEIKVKASERLVQAGERAASLAASLEAKRYFEEALELTEDGAARAGLHERAGQMAVKTGHFDEAAAHFEGAISLFESSGASHAAARVAARLGHIDWQLDRIGVGIERMERAFTILSIEEADADLASLAAELGRLHYFAGDPDRAEARLEVALEAAERLRLPEPLSQALNTKGLLRMDGLHLEEGQALLDRALKVALEHDIPSAALRAYNNISFMHWALDRPDEAWAISRPGVELARRVGDRPWEWSLLLNGADALIYLGKWDEAQAVMEEVVASEGFDPALVRTELISLNKLHVWRGDLEKAERLLESAGTEGSEDVQTRSVAAIAWSMLLRAKGDYEDARRTIEPVVDTLGFIGMNTITREAFVEVLETLLALDDLSAVEVRLSALERLSPAEMTPFLGAQTARLRGRLAAARDDVAQAGPAYKAAVGMLREMAVPFWLGVTLAEHGEWLVGQGLTEDAKSPLDEARGIFERLRATPWIDRLDRVAAVEPATS
jgi:tetratricopeptide (TPR) repeat protein